MMKFATLNIDWARKLKRTETEALLSQHEFGILVITEAIDLNLPNFKYKYLCEPIPENTIYEGLNYTRYLNDETAYRTIVYSNYPCTNRYHINDPKTSLALKFETPAGNIVVYSTIVGTWFKKQPYAKKELDNLIVDCERLHQLNPNLFIVGDLNTSFRENEKQFSVSTATTEALANLFDRLNLYVPTSNIEQNIDHIAIPKSLQNNVTECNTFVVKDVVSDHKGIYIHLL